MKDEQTRITGRRLMQFGMLLFLLGLLTGLVVPMLSNPRMGLASHLEGVMNGMVLVILGLLWPHLRLGRMGRGIAFWLALYGTFVNWAVVLLAGIWGAGRSMPIAGQGQTGSSQQELLINLGLFSLSAAMIVVSVIVLWGLRGAAIAGNQQAGHQEV